MVFQIIAQFTNLDQIKLQVKGSGLRDLCSHQQLRSLFQRRSCFLSPGSFTFHNTMRNLHPGFLKGHHNPGKPSNKFKTTEEINEITSQVCSLSIRSGPFPLTLHPFRRGAHSSCLVLWWRLPPPTLEWHRTHRVIWLDGVGAFSLRARSTVTDARRGRTCRSTAPAPELSQSTAQVH